MEPEELEKELSNQDDEEKTFLLNWLIAHAPSCEEPDFKGCIDKLTKISGQLTNQSLLTGEVARRIGDLMLRLLRLKLSDFEQCLLDIVSTSLLSISEEVLRYAVLEQGKWIIRPHARISTERQLIPDSKLVDQAMKTWSDRVRESARQGDLYKEAQLHSVLYRFAQFNGNDYSEAYRAIDRMCQTEKGLAVFLKYFKKESLFPDSQFALIEDAEKAVLVTCLLESR